MAQRLALWVAPVAQAGWHACEAELVLPAVAARRTDFLDLHVAVPVIGGGHLAAVGGHADQHRVVPESAAAKLADGELAFPANFRGSGIADV
ncbi:hypothetical protein D9M68_909740 [compost metagenome]